MLTCIACTKQIGSGSLRDQEEDLSETPRTKQAIKTLRAQIKDMAVKASGAYKNCTPCSGSSNENKNGTYADSESGYQYSYRRAASSNSTPRVWGREMEARLKGLSSGEGTPAASVSGRTESVVFMDDDEVKEWVAQVEPGVLITFVSLPQGGNDMKRIRFSREVFNKWQAQRWWADNYDKVMELYNVQRFNRQVPTAPPRSEDENSKLESVQGSPVTPPLTQERTHLPTRMSCSSTDSLVPSSRVATPELSNMSNTRPKTETCTSSRNASTRSSLSRDCDHSGELSASDLETEWVEQDEPGVYITVRALPGGTRELRRVRFSREKFGESHARRWWEENRVRIQQQYL
jgi:hypothetical protein